MELKKEGIKSASLSITTTLDKMHSAQITDTAPLSFNLLLLAGGIIKQKPQYEELNKTF